MPFARFGVLTRPGSDADSFVQVEDLPPERMSLRATVGLPHRTPRPETSTRSAPAAASCRATGYQRCRPVPRSGRGAPRFRRRTPAGHPSPAPRTAPPGNRAACRASPTMEAGAPSALEGRFPCAQRGVEHVLRFVRVPVLEMLRFCVFAAP
jgi:hypothetical protein